MQLPGHAAIAVGNFIPEAKSCSSHGILLVCGVWIGKERHGLPFVVPNAS
jgi:hypothetical protein